MQVLLVLLSLVALNEGAFSYEEPVTPIPGENLEAYRAQVKKMQQESWGEPDKHVGELLAGLTPGQGQNPDEMGSYMEGDMLIITPENTLGNRFAEIDSRFRWPDGIVYYAIDGNYNGEQRARILQGISEFHKHTCIRFEPYTGSEKDYILIQSKNTGCWSALGRTGGKQIVNLQPPGCVSQVGVAMHELMHALGIFHEQSRSDRDDFVDIEWQNIERGKEHNFKQHKYYGLGLTYDYGSLMHYSITAFSKNKQPTISTRFKSSANIGQRKGFSKGDIQKINRLYNCSPQYGENSIEDQSDTKSILNPIKTPVFKPKPGINPSKVTPKYNPVTSKPNIIGIKRPTGAVVPNYSGIRTTIRPYVVKTPLNSIDNFNKNTYNVKGNSIDYVPRTTTINPKLAAWLKKYQSA